MKIHFQNAACVSVSSLYRLYVVWVCVWVCVCAPQCTRKCVCGCRVRAEGQNMFSRRTELSLQHPQCSGGILYLSARRATDQWNLSMLPCQHSCHTRQGSRSKKCVFNSGSKTGNVSNVLINKLFASVFALPGGYLSIKHILTLCRWHCSFMCLSVLPLVFLLFAPKNQSPRSTKWY